MICPSCMNDVMDGSIMCPICGEPIEGYGNNPEPFMDADNGQCCDGCNLKFVIPARLELMKEE